MHKRHFAHVALLLGALAASGGLFAQSFPSRAIALVVGNPADLVGVIKGAEAPPALVTHPSVPAKTR